ncbi:hypothetical protein APSETT445_006251 [Aspergillus pseudonomiae]
MSALREAPSYSPGRSRNSPALFGAGKYSESSDSDYYGASPGAMSKKIPPTAGKRTASLSSNSVLAGAGSDGSPLSGRGGQYSSPDGMGSGQSEQLSSFHDYYSQDDIRPGDKVAVLWAYQPRAGDEFALDRGEMLKVVGIWDDVTIADDCLTKFNDFRMTGGSKGEKPKFIIFKIADNKKEVVVDEVSSEQDYEVFRNKLAAAQDSKGNPAPRYAVYDVEYELGSEGKREVLKNALNIHTSIHADDKGDIEWKTVLNEASGGKAGK